MSFKNDAATASWMPLDGRPPGRRCFAIIDPDAGWKQQWDMFMLVLILFSAIAVPIQLAFDADAEGWFWWMQVAFSLCFVADLAMNFNVGFYEGGVLQTDERVIVQRYLQGWFWIDAPSSVPVEILEVAMTSGGAESPEAIGLLRMLRLFRLVRLLRLLKVDHYVARLEEELEMWPRHRAPHRPPRGPLLETPRRVHRPPLMARRFRLRRLQRQRRSSGVQTRAATARHAGQIRCGGGACGRKR